MSNHSILGERASVASNSLEPLLNERQYVAITGESLATLGGTVFCVVAALS
jgi:hypothetical protein